MVAALALVGFYRPLMNVMPKTEGAAGQDAVARAHSSSAACVKCHEPPETKHFTDDCGFCHSPKRPFAQPQLAHVTFGAHTNATQACDTCHTGKPASEIACRACHGTACGKNAKTAKDCVKCHSSGKTKAWIPQ